MFKKEIEEMNGLAFKLGYEAAKSLSGKENALVEEMIQDDEIGENGEHSCLDATDGTGNINDEGTCMVCGLTDLI